MVFQDEEHISSDSLQTSD